MSTAELKKKKGQSSDDIDGLVNILAKHVVKKNSFIYSETAEDGLQKDYIKANDKLAVDLREAVPNLSFKPRCKKAAWTKLLADKNNFGMEPADAKTWIDVKIGSFDLFCRHIMQTEGKGTKAPSWFKELQCCQLYDDDSDDSDVHMPLGPKLRQLEKKTAAEGGDKQIAYLTGYNFEVDKPYRKTSKTAREEYGVMDCLGLDSWDFPKARWLDGYSCDVSDLTVETYKQRKLAATTSRRCKTPGSGVLWVHDSGDLHIARKPDRNPILMFRKCENKKWTSLITLRISHFPDEEVAMTFLKAMALDYANGKIHQKSNWRLRKQLKSRSTIWLRPHQPRRNAVAVRLLPQGNHRKQSPRPRAPTAKKKRRLHKLHPRNDQDLRLKLWAKSAHRRPLYSLLRQHEVWG